MIRKWVISKLQVDWNKESSAYSFVGKFQISKKSMTLYDKNSNKNFTFLYPKQCENMLAYFIYRNIIPRCFSNIISQVKEPPMLNQTLRDEMIERIYSGLEWNLGERCTHKKEYVSGITNENADIFVTELADSLLKFLKERAVDRFFIYETIAKNQQGLNGRQINKIAVALSQQFLILEVEK